MCNEIIEGIRSGCDCTRTRTVAEIITKGDRKMSEYHGKYYNPSHEDDYGAYLSGECDANNIDRCNALSKLTSLKICEKCPMPDEHYHTSCQSPKLSTTKEEEDG